MADRVYVRELAARAEALEAQLSPVMAIQPSSLFRQYIGVTANELTGLDEETAELVVEAMEGLAHAVIRRSVHGGHLELQPSEARSVAIAAIVIGTVDCAAWRARAKLHPEGELAQAHAVALFDEGVYRVATDTLSLDRGLELQ